MRPRSVASHATHDTHETETKTKRSRSPSYRGRTSRSNSHKPPICTEHLEFTVLKIVIKMDRKKPLYPKPDFSDSLSSAHPSSSKPLRVPQGIPRGTKAHDLGNASKPEFQAVQGWVPGRKLRGTCYLAQRDPYYEKTRIGGLRCLPVRF